MRALAEMGHSPRRIGKTVGRSNKTVAKYLATVAYTDPDIDPMVREIKVRELQDLYVLGAKARAQLHDQVDAGTMATIPLIALMDRSFQQRQLLEGKPTEIMNIRSVMAHFEAELEAVRAAREALGHVEIIEE